MTDRRSPHRLLRLTAAGLLLLGLCLACTVSEGERATTGECPEGEVCSDATPRGLSFYGPFPGDGDAPEGFLRRVAMGGTSSLWLGAGTVGSGDEDAGALGAWEIESTAPWLLEAEANGEAGEYTTWTGDGTAQLRGLAEGESTLRVLEPESGELYDRITIGVERVTRVDGVVIGGASEDTLPAGAHATVVFRLHGDGDTRLVDEGLAVESDTTFERWSWDGVELDVPAGADEVVFVVEAGHRRWEVRLPVRG